MKRDSIAVSPEFSGHDYVNHGTGEYGRGEAQTNIIGGLHSICKRGMEGVNQHFSKKHL